MQRRRFLQAAGVAGLAACRATGATTRSLGDAEAGTCRLAVKLGMVGGDAPLADKFRIVRELGFEGVELDSPSDLDPNEVLDARDASGLVIHGVVDSVHWSAPLSDPDPAVRARGVAGLERALRDARLFGGSTVLLVPALVRPEVGYADAYERSQTEIRRVLPLAEELGITIALENVWNHFLLSPLEAARYVDELESERIGWYFDVGNVVNYGWPEHWIRALGPRIVKLDVKEFSRAKRDAEGLWKGFDVEIGDGDCGWPDVRRALDEIGFGGWATAEVRGGDAERLRDVHRRMSRVLGPA